MMRELVLVLDFGGQYKELIARAIRSFSVYSEIRSGEMSIDEIRSMRPIGIILTGGPDRVNMPGSPMCDAGIFELGIPILGICYGMQIMCHSLGGVVTCGAIGEYGRVLTTPVYSELFYGIEGPFAALMSHKDMVTELPPGFITTAFTEACPNAACENTQKRLYGTQFHPEASHTDAGQNIFKNFLYNICGASGEYKLDDYIKAQIDDIRLRTGKRQVLLALSGGVDSSVCAALLSEAIPGQLVCIFVDHGFMRQNEGDEIEEAFTKLKLRFIRVNAQERFLKRIRGIREPEIKRKIIGEEFIRVFEEAADSLGEIELLAQGTIYPDIVESGGKYGAAIKSHHNVGGIPGKLVFKEILEPLRGLFKDEVRALGIKLGVSHSIVNRQPFPGPGLAIRVIGEVTQNKLNILRQADSIFLQEISKLNKKPEQYFAVLTDTRSVGVKGDDRTYDSVVAIRAVETTDFMTCEYAEIPHTVLRRVSSRVTNEIASVSRVVYDITSKPPATIEWE